MDAGLFGSVATVVSFLLFIGIVWWTFSRNNKQKFDDAAGLPFREDVQTGDKTGHAPN